MERLDSGLLPFHSEAVENGNYERFVLLSIVRGSLAHTRKVVTSLRCRLHLASTSFAAFYLFRLHVFLGFQRLTSFWPQTSHPEGWTCQQLSSLVKSCSSASEKFSYSSASAVMNCYIYFFVFHVFMFLSLFFSVLFMFGGSFSQGQTSRLWSTSSYPWMSKDSASKDIEINSANASKSIEGCGELLTWRVVFRCNYLVGLCN